MKILRKEIFFGWLYFLKNINNEVLLYYIISMILFGVTNIVASCFASFNLKYALMASSFSTILFSVIISTLSLLPCLSHKIRNIYFPLKEGFERGVIMLIILFFIGIIFLGFGIINLFNAYLSFK